MTTALILLVSGVLIGAGISLVLRDSRAKRRAFVPEPDARPQVEGDGEAEVEIKVSYDARRSERPALPAAATSAPDRPPLPGAEPRPTVPLPPVREAMPPRRSPGPSLEQEWASLQPTIAGGVEKVNAVLAAVRLSVSPSGEASWSYKNRGYGAYRRVLLQGESVAWLRLELTTEGKLSASVKAHKEERSDINSSSEAPTKGLTPASAADLLSRCLRLAAAHAVRQQPGGDGDEEEASRRAWESVDGMVAAALQATNGALAQAGARLNPLAPASWEGDLRRHRMTLSVLVNGDDVARMHIERFPHEMEVAVGVREPHLVDLGRRRRVPIEGMTIHALAELMASCAWPAIARFRELTHPRI